MARSGYRELCRGSCRQALINMKKYIYFLFVAALICGCDQAHEASEPKSVRLAPNVVMNIFEVDRDTDVDAQTGKVLTRTPYLCVQLLILYEDESDIEIVELPDFVKTERPFKGYERAVLQVHEHIEDQVFVDVMEAVKRAGARDIQINPCRWPYS